MGNGAPGHRPSALNGPRVVWRAVLLAALLFGAWLEPAWISELASYPLLGVIPGLVLVELLLPAVSSFTRVTVGIAVAPLLSALAGLALVASGLSFPRAAAITAAAGIVLWLLLGLRTRRTAAEPGEDVPIPRAALGIAIGLAVGVALPPLLNRYIAVRGDSWTHGAIAIEILERGFPPEDPRFAAIPLNYAWFYDLFIGLLASLHARPPFYAMAFMNVATAFATVALAVRIALGLWRRREAGVGAAVLMVFGLNAGAYLLWPLQLLRAFVGVVRGENELRVQLHAVELGSARIIYSLGAPFSRMVSFLDKLLVGSPLAYGYLLMLLHVWALLQWLGGGGAVYLPWIALASAGMFLFHGVVGLSVVPVWLGTLALAILLRRGRPWLPSVGRLAGGAAVTLAGALVTVPYTISVATGWTPEKSGLHHSYLLPDPAMPWTFVTACGVALWFALRPTLAAWKGGRAEIATLGLYVAAMVAFACVVRLPSNNQMKFVFLAFAPALTLAAPTFWEAVLRYAHRAAAQAAVVLTLVFAVPPALTLQGYFADRGSPAEPSLRETPGEGALNAWIREQTPKRAVIVDHRFRELVEVQGRRQLYLGTDQGVEFGGWPRDQLLERRRVVADLYGAARDLPGDVRSLERLGRPIYVVFRPEDDAETARAWSVLRGSRARFEPAFESEGYRVLRLVPAGS
jgi:hypothetical protein